MKFENTDVWGFEHAIRGMKNYEVLRNIVPQRARHKLSEWQSFIDWVNTLPYANELIFYKGEN